MSQLFLVLCGLFVLATPVLVIALYVRHTKLQARVKAVEEGNSRAAAALHREIADLQRQVTALRVPATTRRTQSTFRPRQ